MRKRHVAEKPRLAAGYRPEETTRVRAACLTLATTLGDLLDEIVVVGGLAPVLWGEARKLQPDALAPVGTVDVDVGIAVSLLEQERYREIAERLLRSGFVPDTNEEGNPTPQRWIFGTGGPTVDFLIEPTSATEVPGRIKHLDEAHKFGALLAVGIDLALLLHTEIRLEQATLEGELASRVIRVCDAGPFVVLKALAFRGRGERKDAYDIFYTLRNYGSGPEEVADQLRPHRGRSEVVNALGFLREDFATTRHLGPMRVAAFLGEEPGDDIRADAVGFVQRFLSRLS